MTAERRMFETAAGSAKKQGTTWGHSSFNEESSGPDGIISGRSGYVDSSGANVDRHYVIGRDGQRRYIDKKESKLNGPAPSFNYGPMPGAGGFGAGNGDGDDFLSGRSGFGSLPGFGNIPGFGNFPGFGGAGRMGGRV